MTKKNNSKLLGEFLGKLISFRNSLKLIHWSVTGKGSYETHMSLDEASDSLTEITDRLVETTFAVQGAVDIVIPQTTRPKDFIEFIQNYYSEIEEQRESLFPESFSQSILDDVQETIQQLLYRLKRLE